MLGGKHSNQCEYFLPANFNKFVESKCYFFGNLVPALVIKLLVMVEFPPTPFFFLFFFFIIKLKH